MAAWYRPFQSSSHTHLMRKLLVQEGRVNLGSHPDTECADFLDKDLIRGVILVFLTCVSLASLVSSNENKKTVTSCSDGLGLNYTLPMFNECKKKLHSNGSMVQTFPKLIPYSSAEAACPRRKSKLGIPPGHRICRFPDCGENTCRNGWCEETMTNFRCHCSAGYQGKRCDKQSTTTQDTKTMSTTEVTTSHPTTTTQSSTTQDTTTMSSTGATTSHPTTTTQSTTTQDTTTMSTTEATHPTTTTQSTTTQDTTTMSSTEATTSHPTTTTQSTAKIFVTDKGTDNKIFVADLQADLNFSSIPSTKEPRFITYDSVDKKIYWTDNDTKRVYRADEDGENMENVTFGRSDELRGITIAETSRTLYIANKSQKKITSVSIAQGSSFPRVETNFTFGLPAKLYSLEVDEEKGFLYWSMNNEILRKPLNGSGSTETVYSNSDLSKIKGLSIDLSRNPRRIFFCDFEEQRTFYKDVNQSLTMDPHGLAAARELTDYMNGPDISGDEEQKELRDIKYFNGTLYWTKVGRPKGIVVMTNYDQSSPSFDIKETSVIRKPFQFIITNVDP